MKLMVTVDGKVYEVDVEVAPGPAPTLPTFLAQSGAAVVAANPSAAAADTAVNEDKVCGGPVAGIALKSNVRPGQTILPGDLLFVLESMKRETEITAPVVGKVAEVKLSVGDSLKSGQVASTWA